MAKVGAVYGAEFVEVLPGRLVWAPEAHVVPSEFTELAATDLIGDPKALYTVMHYPKQSVGRAFGPVALDKTIDFCFELFQALAKAAAKSVDSELGPCIALTTPAQDLQMRTNVVTMLGVYLVLRHGWTAEKVRTVLGKEDANRLFACSWSRTNRPEGKRHHKVYDCWSGMELARQLEWIHSSVVSEPRANRQFVNECRQWVTTYDAAWVVPGRLLVCADPGTTAHDSNPATFKNIFPGSANTTPRKVSGQQSLCPSDASRRSDASRSTNSWKFSRLKARGMPRWVSNSEETQSTDTVCKDFANSDSSQDTLSLDSSLGDLRAVQTDENTDFVSFLKMAGVRVMIRCNYDDEPGMPSNGGYSSEDMQDSGIAHSDIVVPDYDGGLPTRKGCRNAIELVSSVLHSPAHPNAVAVHCKGGFGRSVVLACCIAIDHFDVPGDALMGWVRMSRPGAITTPIQERFLKSMTGRKALRRWAGLPVLEDEGDDMKMQPKCGAGCSVM